MRAAIYFTPPADASLTRAAAEWLGRDAFASIATRPPDPAIDAWVAEPARYGFHATLRAPFRPRDGTSLGDIEDALRSFARDRSPFVLPEIGLARLGRFFALVPARPSEDLSDLEGAVLEAFEPFRALLNEAERNRRRLELMTARQRANLERWGYPHVREDFRFHMTLTGQVPDAAAETVHTLLRDRFGAFDGTALSIDRVAIFVEEEPGAPFKVAASAVFAG